MRDFKISPECNECIRYLKETVKNLEAGKTVHIGMSREMDHDGYSHVWKGHNRELEVILSNANIQEIEA